MSKILKSRPTQKQIAEKLGLSAATVSLALRDNPVVAKSTRELVQQAMRDTGYVRNLAAASLRTGRSNIVGVSLPNVACDVYGDLLMAVERAFEETGTVIVINNHEGDVEKVDRFISTLATYGADALLIAPPCSTPETVLKRAGDHGMPILYLGTVPVGGDAEAESIGMDDHAAGVMAARHLIDRGYERLYIVGGREGDAATEARVVGFREALAEADMPWDDTLRVPCAADAEDASGAWRAVLERTPAPTGIVCANDLTARGACRVLREYGMQPGADIGLIGIGSERGREFSVPLLTMVCADTSVMGRLGATAILSRLENPEAEARRVLLEPVLLPGETTMRRH